MCHPSEADVAARKFPRIALDGAVAPCPQTVTRALQPYDILLIASYSRGTGEVAAALNVLPYLRGCKVFVLYGNPQTIPEHIAARDEMQRLVSIDPPARDDEEKKQDSSSSSSAPWNWTNRDGFTYRPLARVVPGTRPVLILAPHFYTYRDLEIRGPLAAGSLRASWGPLALPNPDIGDELGMLITAMGEPPLAPPITHRDPFMQIAVRPQPFNDSAARGNDGLIVEAFAERDRMSGSGLACIYGHGTYSDPAAVLKRLLEAAAAGTREEQWAIIVVVHHKSDADEPKGQLARPMHLLDATQKIRSGRWDVRVTGPSSGVYTNTTLRLKVYHMLGLGKACMDWMFRCADLPIMEGANTIQQVMGAGRPFLRVAEKTDHFLGNGTRVVQGHFTDERSVAAMCALQAAASYLIGTDASGAAAQTIRALLFGLPERGGLDTFAGAVRDELERERHNPLLLLVYHLQRLKSGEGSSASVSTEERDIAFLTIPPN